MCQIILWDTLQLGHVCVSDLLYNAQRVWLQTLEAVNMMEGSTLWTFDQKENKEARVDVMNIYTALYVMDLDGDGVADIVITHGGDPLAKPGLLSILNNTIHKMLIFIFNLSILIRVGAWITKSYIWEVIIIKIFTLFQ